MSSSEAARIRAFECQIRGADWRTTVHATTRGKARAEYWRHAREPFPDLRFTDILVRGVGPAVTSDDFQRTADYRGVPFARVGMAVEVGGDRGLIVGHNSSANFDVHFQGGPHSGLTLNCHPRWQFKYFNSDGSLIAEFGG